MSNEISLRGAGLALMPKSIAEVEALGAMLSDSMLVPDHLRKKPADCALIVLQAVRWGLDPLGVAQCTSIVHGRLCYEGKLVASVLSSVGAIEGRLEYEHAGADQNMSIVVSGTPTGGKKVSVPGSVKGWRTFGKDKAGNRIDNAWDKDPYSMLVYRGTRQWARLHAPEALLGLVTPDDMEAIAQEPTTYTATIEPEAPPTSKLEPECAPPAEKPAYPDDRFAAQLQKIRASIKGGQEPQVIISSLSKKYTLSPGQIGIIKAIPDDLAIEASYEQKIEGGEGESS